MKPIYSNKAKNSIVWNSNSTRICWQYTRCCGTQNKAVKSHERARTYHSLAFSALCVISFFYFIWQMSLWKLTAISLHKRKKERVCAEKCICRQSNHAFKWTRNERFPCTVNWIARVHTCSRADTEIKRDSFIAYDVRRFTVDWKYQKLLYCPTKSVFRVCFWPNNDKSHGSFCLVLFFTQSVWMEAFEPCMNLKWCVRYQH